MPNKLLDMMYAPRFQDGGALTPQEIERLNKLKRASQLTGYGEGPGMRAFQEMGDVGRGLLGAEAIIPGGEGYRTGQALANMPAVGVAAVPGKVASALPEVVTGLGALGAGVIKPKGGNWLAGSVERAIEPLKRPLYPGRLPFGNDAQAIAAALGETPEYVMRNADPSSVALNKWVDTKLTKYIKNEMGTPEDPVRALAERGTLHFEPQGGAVRSHTMRAAAGMPTEPTATTPLARAWEDVSDAAVMRGQYQDMIPFAESGEEGLRKYGGEYAVKNPQAVAYAFDTGALPSDMGFPHIIDELTNAMNPNSGLPASLRLTPQQLEKVTVPQAVKRVAKINEWRAAQKAEADALRARNPATFEHRAYETIPGTAEPNKKGLRWVELKIPESKMPEDFSTWSKQEQENYLSLPDLASKKQLEEALKYEGEVMGHCVGGYCPDVIEGRSRIYSLRDKKGEPHVTIEVTPRRKDTDQLLTANQLPPEIRADYERRNVLDPLMRFDPKTFLPELGRFEDEIVQIKGKGNKAPKEEYLPFVQDFVRSGNWSRVGDLKNTGLQRLQDLRLHPELVKQARERYGEYLSSSDLEELFRPKPEESMKAGGSVHISDNLDTMRLELLRKKHA